MLIGYARVSKSDWSQVLDLQVDELMKQGVNQKYIYHAQDLKHV
jgi:predicted site-specific integrase-resolvase